MEGKKSDDEIGTMKEEKMLELEERKIFQEAEELQNRLAFYKTNENYAEQAADTQIAIEENKIKQLELKAKKEELANKQKIKWENWAKKYEVDIYERSANAVMDTYTALATGQIKSLEDFKNFAQMQLAELLLSLGQENAAKAVSKTAEAIGYATNPATASLAPPAFASAAKHAAVAAAFGIAATLVRPDEKTEGTNNKENAITKYDEGIDNRINSAQKENEGDVVIDISDSQMSKLWIKQIEKELNDGYNVTLIGKKKGNY